MHIYLEYFTNILCISMFSTDIRLQDTLDKSNKAANARRDAAKLEEEQQKQMEDELEQKINMHFADPKQSNNNEEKKKKLSLSQAKDNPYVRKEVSYVCEVGTDLPSVVGGIFRRVKEARELGEAHGRDVEIRLGKYCVCVVYGDMCINFCDI